VHMYPARMPAKFFCLLLAAASPFVTGAHLLPCCCRRATALTSSLRASGCAGPVRSTRRCSGATASSRQRYGRPGAPPAPARVQAVDERAQLLHLDSRRHHSWPVSHTMQHIGTQLICCCLLCLLSAGGSWVRAVVSRCLVAAGVWRVRCALWRVARSSRPLTAASAGCTWCAGCGTTRPRWRTVSACCRALLCGAACANAGWLELLCLQLQCCELWRPTEHILGCLFSRSLPVLLMHLSQCNRQQRLAP
jgi:hypothetical protein